MKKLALLFISVFLLVGCETVMNNPTKRVETFLNKYQTTDSEVLSQLDTTLNNDTTLTSTQKEDYRNLMKKQYQNLTYTIKDSSGNENSTSRVVNVIKKNITTTYVGPKVTTTQKPVVKTTTRANVITKPIITLIGSETIIIYQGNKYKELGYSAKDALGNDITVRVNIMNDININKAGSYIVKYTVTDNYGNTTTKIRSVIVKEKSIEVQYLTLTPDKITIKKNSQVQITPNYNSNATAGTQITWKSSNTSVAVVNQNGLITAKNPGVVTITATSSNGKVAKAYITVTEK